MKKIIPFILLLIILLVIVTSFVTVAEYSDISDSTVLTMNQQIQNGDFSNGTTGFIFSNTTGSIVDNHLQLEYTGSSSNYFQNGFRTSFDVQLSHIYYISIDIQSDKSFTFGIDTASKNYFNGTYTSSDNFTTFDFIANIVSVQYTTFFWGIYQDYVSVGDIVNIDNLYIIDLTLMFGSGNEPDLDECRSLFTAEYYPYSTGTPLTTSGVNAYQQGYNDAVQSVTITTSPSLTYSSILPLNINGATSDVTKLSSEGDYFFGIDNYVSIPLNAIVPSGSSITFYADTFYVEHTDNTPYIQFGYISGSTFIPVYSIDYSTIGQLSTDTDSWTYRISGQTVGFTFTLPVSVSNFVIYAPQNGTPGIQRAFSFSNAYVEFATYSSYQAIQNSYDSGYKNGSTAGYNQGYQSAIEKASQGEFTFTKLLSSVIETPINVLMGDYNSDTGLREGGLFNFEFLGYNMSTFLMSLLAVALVIVLVRLFVR